jgi:hypothetical protein
MAEKITSGVEKMFFHYILNNNKYFDIIIPEHFQNEIIQIVYNIIRDEYIVSEEKYIPSPDQIFNMVVMNGMGEKVTPNILKSLLNDSGECNKDWLEKRFKSWYISNVLEERLFKIMEQSREYDKLDIDKTTSFLNSLQNVFTDITPEDNSDSDFVADFDDIETHKTNETNKKMSTGWACMDTVMCGGWDQSSFNVLIGETNIGKCCCHDTIITIRDINTNEIFDITIGEFYKML